MHTLLSKLAALSIEKYYIALTQMQLKIYRFHGSLSRRGSRPLVYSIKPRLISERSIFNASRL